MTGAGRTRPDVLAHTRFLARKVELEGLPHAGALHAHLADQSLGRRHLGVGTRLGRCRDRHAAAGVAEASSAARDRNAARSAVRRFRLDEPDRTRPARISRRRHRRRACRGEFAPLCDGRRAHRFRPSRSVDRSACRRWTRSSAGIAWCICRLQTSRAALAQFRASGSRFLIATTFTDHLQNDGCRRRRLADAEPDRCAVPPAAAPGAPQRGLHRGRRGLCGQVAGRLEPGRA